MLGKTITTSQLTNFWGRFDWDGLLHQLTVKVSLILLTCLLFWLILAIGKSILNSLFKNTNRISLLGGTKRAETFHSIIGNIYRYTCYFFFLYAILSLIGVPVGTLVAGAGIFSIALGLGAQGFVSDVVNGFFILLEEQIDVGDTVQIGTIKGTVQAIGLRTTQVLSADGTLTFIQNRNITMIQNFSRHDLSANIDILINAQTPLDQLHTLIESLTPTIMEQHPELTQAPQIIGPTTNTNGQLVYRIMITATSGTQFQAASEILASYLQTAREQGLTLPIPINTK